MDENNNSKPLNKVELPEATVVQSYYCSKCRGSAHPSDIGLTPKREVVIIIYCGICAQKEAVVLPIEGENGLLDRCPKPPEPAVERVEPATWNADDIQELLLLDQAFKTTDRYLPPRTNNS